MGASPFGRGAVGGNCSVRTAQAPLYFFLCSTGNKKASNIITLPITNTTLTKSAATLVNMVRKLKHHEQKLLRKTDFITYKQDNDHRDKAVVRRYNIQKPEDYFKYNKICGVSLL